MKGQLSAMMAAVSYFAKDTNKDFEGELYVAGVVHEELFEGIASRKISEAVKPDYVVIGESSELNLKIGQRGREKSLVETFGKPAHSANPHKGINAVYKMSKIIEAITRISTTNSSSIRRRYISFNRYKVISISRSISSSRVLQSNI